MIRDILQRNSTGKWTGLARSIFKDRYLIFSEAQKSCDSAQNVPSQLGYWSPILQFLLHLLLIFYLIPAKEWRSNDLDLNVLGTFCDFACRYITLPATCLIDANLNSSLSLASAEVRKSTPSDHATHSIPSNGGVTFNQRKLSTRPSGNQAHQAVNQLPTYTPDIIQ